MVQLVPPKKPRSQESEKLEVPDYGELLNRCDRGRVVIFVDGASLFYSAAQLGMEIDYTKLLRYLTQGGRLVHAFFYTGVDPTNEKQKGFHKWMRCNGYRVIAKELITFSDGSKKANLNVEIAIDMLKLAGHCDTVVLASGNGELAYAVNAVTYKGVQTEILSLRCTTSDRLINVADCYIDLETIKHEIQATPKASRISIREVNSSNILPA
jgi:uncharacterized LabA/DUF88 family protein